MITLTIQHEVVQVQRKVETFSAGGGCDDFVTTSYTFLDAEGEARVSVTVFGRGAVEETHG